MSQYSKMKKLKPFSIKYISQRWKNNPIREVTFINKYKWSLRKIKTFIQARADAAYEQGYNHSILATIRFKGGNIKYSSGRWFDTGDDVIMPFFISIDDLGKVKEFKLYISEKPINKGGKGKDKYNDCLFYALKKANVMPYKNGLRFKKFLGIERTESVSIDLIPMIEDRCKCNINLLGDHIMPSNKEYQRSIFIKIINGHYTLRNKGNKTKGISYKERKPIVYDSRTQSAYCPERIWEFKMSEDEFRSIKKNPLTSEWFIHNVKSNENLKKQYEDLVRDATILKEKTDGRINLFKTECTKNAAICLHKQMTLSINPEEILQDEAVWIRNAYYGALGYVEKDYKGYGAEYDIKSCYPSIMCKTNLLIPIKRGTFKILSEQDFNEGYLRIGIYRCIIDDNGHKLFRSNPANYYTHYDITRARELDLDIELICDGNHNFLYYERNKCLTGHELFKEFVDYMFKLKQENVPYSKNIINILHGALNEKKKQYVIVNMSDTKPEEDININIPFDDVSLLDIREFGHQRKLNYVDNENIFASNYARTGPFLTSKVRQHVSKLFMPYYDQIVRLNTDGFVSNKPIDIDLGDNLGDVALKWQCDNIYINHINNIIDIETNTSIVGK